MSGQASKRPHVWATTGRPPTARKSLSTPGPIRVPWPAATMSAVFTLGWGCGAGVPARVQAAASNRRQAPRSRASRAGERASR